MFDLQASIIAQIEATGGRHDEPELTIAEKNRHLTEQAAIGRLGGADRVPQTVDVDAYVERMRPPMAMNEQTVEFIGFLAGRVGDEPESDRAARVIPPS